MTHMTPNYITDMINAVTINSDTISIIEDIIAEYNAARTEDCPIPEPDPAKVEIIMRQYALLMCKLCSKHNKEHAEVLTEFYLACTQALKYFRPERVKIQVYKAFCNFIAMQFNAIMHRLNCGDRLVKLPHNYKRIDQTYVNFEEHFLANEDFTEDPWAWEEAVGLSDIEEGE